ncbi:hypothetical protein BJV78DRAFT_1173974 [Lactifluus subvellereus]|nr:hypothetical protein BJV78DRAFT_1173974 [Lactifluus subvellereus]
MAVQGGYAGTPWGCVHVPFSLPKIHARPNPDCFSHRPAQPGLLIRWRVDLKLASKYE